MTIFSFGRLAIMLALLACIPRNCWATNPGSPARATVVLLKNGATLQGRVTPAGDRYIVSLGNSDVVRIPVDAVANLCQSLDAAYNIKRQALDDSLQSRIDLARWCLEQGMPARAADQLLAAEQAHGMQPQIALLHQRLLRTAAPPAPAKHDVPETNGTDDTASAIKLKDLPEHAVEEFTSAVQPLLINRCGATGCHGGRGNDEFVLTRPRSGRPMTRRMTERNLLSTLQQVDRAAIKQSALLKKARSPHGDADRAPILDRETVQFGVLARWLERIAPKPLPKTNKLARRNEVLFQQASGGRAITNEEAVAPQAKPAGDNTAPADQDAEHRDPFDPGVFNQRYHPDQRVQD